MGDFEQLPDVVAACCPLGSGSELTFAYAQIAGVIRACMRRGVAVLGVELFKILPDRLQAEGSTDWEGDAPARERLAADLANNRLASVFVAENCLLPEHVYILTAVSEREYRQLSSPPPKSDG